MRVYRSERGYTILEVLVSVAIFTAIVTLASAALDQGLKQYHRLVEKGINFWDSAKYLWMNRNFSCIVDYYVKPRGTGEIFPYFQGSRDLISFVTLAPLASETPVVVWIERQVNAEGGSDLVYYELPVYAMQLDDIERVYNLLDYKKGRSTVLMANLDNVETEFYGLDAVTERWEWTSTYDGRAKQTLPSLVRIDFREKGDPENKRLFFYIQTNSRFKVGEE
jgi:general secretion pathway protein J